MLFLSSSSSCLARYLGGCNRHVLSRPGFVRSKGGMSSAYVRFSSSSSYSRHSNESKEQEDRDYCIRLVRDRDNEGYCESLSLLLWVFFSFMDGCLCPAFDERTVDFSNNQFFPVLFLSLPCLCEMCDSLTHCSNSLHCTSSSSFFFFV
jgi:hypothetical protein